MGYLVILLPLFSVSQFSFFGNSEIRRKISFFPFLSIGKGVCVKAEFPFPTEFQC